MRFDPQDAIDDLLPEGWHEATIVGAYDGTSKSGNPMLVVTFGVNAKDGERHHVIEYFVSHAKPALTRLRKLCDVLGLDFSSGEVRPADLLHRSVEAYVKTHEDETGQYPPKNVAAAFRSLWHEDESGEEQSDVTGDDIPF